MTQARRLSFGKRIEYAFETAAAYLVYGFFRLLPLAAASSLGGWLLRKIGPRMGISRVALANLDLAFPEKPAQEKRRILNGMWENIGRVVAEYPHLGHLWQQVEVRGEEHLAARAAGKPSIFFGGHLANWEINAIAARNMRLPVYLVYRKPNNPWVDGLLRHARNAGAAGHIGKGMEGAREILALLRQGKAVGMLIDQKLSEGIPVPFFGHDAMTSDAMARFALKLGCTLYPVRVERLRGATFRVTLHPPLAVESTGDREADIRRITAAANALLESWIRERPEQWLWIHRRWPQSRRSQ